MDIPFYKDDQALVRKAARSDAGAMRLIVERHQQSIYRLAYRLVGDVDVAQDVTQDTFLKAFENMHRIRNGQVLRFWLYRTARNLIKDRWKSKKKMVPFDTMAPFLTHDTSDPAKEAESQEKHERIQAALIALPAIYREAFVLKYVEDMDYQTISTVLDVGISAAKVRVHRACKALKEMLPEFDRQDNKD